MTDPMHRDERHDRPPAASSWYCDRTDPRFLVPAPNNFRGWTFNLAHPLTWAFVAVIVVVPVAVMAVVLFR